VSDSIAFWFVALTTMCGFWFVYGIGVTECRRWRREREAKKTAESIQFTRIEIDTLRQVVEILDGRHGEDARRIVLDFVSQWKDAQEYKPQVESESRTLH